jgi:hypothetical protein
MRGMNSKQDAKAWSAAVREVNAANWAAAEVAGVLSPTNRLQSFSIRATRRGWRINLFFITAREESIKGSYLLLRCETDPNPEYYPTEKDKERLLRRMLTGKQAYRVLKHPC